jgi:hypothetical protein
MDAWLRQVNPKFNIPMANRIAKVVKVFDWDTAEGVLLLQEREKTGKWGKLNPKDFKFVLKVYYPDLVRDKKAGITAEEVVPRCYPETVLNLFELLPVWMLSSLQKEEKDILKLIVDTDKKTTKQKTDTKDVPQ